MCATVVVSLLSGSWAAGAAPVRADPAAEAQSDADGEARDDDPWRAYDAAFLSLLAGDRTAALRRLQELARLHPDHPAGTRAAELARALALRPAPAAEPVSAPPAGLPSDGPTSTARAELIVFQTLHGVAVGTELCLSLQCKGVRAHALSLMLSGGLGLGLSIALTTDGISPGHTALLDTGTFWGAWNGLGVAASTNQRSPWKMMLVGQAAGLGLGAALWSPAQPTAGQVALASTFGGWSTVLTGLTMATLKTGSGNADIWTPLLLAGDVGLVVGAAVGRHRSISRGRTLLIDAGGILGLLLGGVLATGTSDVQSAALAALVGTGVGLTVATTATAGWDTDGSRAGPPLPRVVPTPLRGHGVGLLMGGSF